MSKIFTPLGASNHTKETREENDFYATDPAAIDWLFKVESFRKDIWEPAAGMGHLSERIIALGHNVRSTDLIDRGYPDCMPGIDFLQQTSSWHGDIITNPPYSKGLDFVEKSLELIDNGAKVAMFLKLTFLEGKTRRKLYDRCPPKIVYTFSSRIRCAKNGDFSTMIKDEETGEMKKIGSSAACYAWFVWEKGYTGRPGLGWIG